MKISSATFFVKDYKGSHYKVVTTPAVTCVEREKFFALEDCLWCRIYRSIGIDDSPEWNRIYENDYSAGFYLYKKDCEDLYDNNAVETVIRQNFNDDFWVDTLLGEETESDKERSDDTTKRTALELLAEYEHIISPEKCAEVASKMAEFIKKQFC